MAGYIIFKKELRTYFTSPWMLFVFSAFSLLLTVRYLVTLDSFIQSSMMPQGKPPNIHDVLFIPHLNWVYMTFLVLIPLMAMRLIAEERKERTMDLLFTVPITTSSIVIGKFFAAWFLVSFMIFIAFLFPLTTSLVSKFDWGPLLGSYIGMLFMAGFNVALCLMASSLTSSTVLSGFFGFLFILVVMIFGSSGIHLSQPALNLLVEQLSIGSHLHDYFQGILNLKSFVFLISGIVLFCFISFKSIESLRWK